MRTLLCSLVALLIAAPLLLVGDGLEPAEVRAAGTSAVRVEVLVDGRVLPEYSKRRATYIEALRGKEYSIRLSNDSPGRVAVALSVDGLNTIDAKRGTARSASKWVIAPGDSVTVRGWQVGSDRARQFVFTSEERSYGTWLGETRNLGVISAVFFGEEPRGDCCDVVPFTGPGDSPRGDRVPEPVAPERSQSSSRAGGMGAADDRDPTDGSPAELEAPRAEESRTAPRRRSSSEVARPAPKKERAATGTGRRLRHQVEWVEFVLDPSPLAELDLRYGFRDELVELGVLPEDVPDRSLTRRESASGFAPDPGASCCR